MKIINEVKKRPALYDLNLPLEARCKKARKRLWTEISEIVNGRSITFFAVNIKMHNLFICFFLAPTEDVIRRWRSLRDRYTKYRRQYMSSLQDGQCDSGIKTPQYMYSRYLKFLEPIIEKQYVSLKIFFLNLRKLN